LGEGGEGAGTPLLIGTALINRGIGAPADSFTASHTRIPEHQNKKGTGPKPRALSEVSGAYGFTLTMVALGRPAAPPYDTDPM
jgi:hypothetical protein